MAQRARPCLLPRGRHVAPTELGHNNFPADSYKARTRTHRPARAAPHLGHARTTGRSASEGRERTSRALQRRYDTRPLLPRTAHDARRRSRGRRTDPIRTIMNDGDGNLSGVSRTIRENYPADPPVSAVFGRNFLTASKPGRATLAAARPARTTLLD
jgi:hypothetical protein